MTTNIKAIAELSEKLALLSNQLQSGSSISELDKELLKQYCIAAYEQVLLLNTTAIKEIIAEVEPHALPVNQNEVAIEQPITPIEQEVLITSSIEVIEQSTPTLFDEIEAVIKTETEIQNELIDEIIEQQQEAETHSNPVVLLKDVISELSLHEKIANTLTSKPDLSERLANSAIPSLKSAINVNLKIAIVNDLFKENTVEYVKAIDKLNASENIHEAMRYFTELKHNYDWQTDNTLVKELESLINKRFL